MSAGHASDAEELEALTQFLYLAPIGLVQATTDGEIVMINPMSAQLMMPLSPSGELCNLYEVLGDVAPDLRHRVHCFGAARGMICDGMHLCPTARSSSQPLPQILSLTLLKLDDTRLMAVLSDVSQSVHRERALRRSQAWIESIIAGISDYALVTLDGAGKLCGWNDSVGRVTGYDKAHSVGLSYASFYADDTLPQARMLDHMHEARRDGWSTDEGWRLRADGSRFWGSCLIAPLDVGDEPLPDEPAFSLIVRDISDRKNAHDALRQAVSCDHLTGLANRRAFYDAAEHELTRWQRLPRPLSLVLIDADHFKAVNDRHGHASGDAVLRHLAIALGATFRAMDVIARVGGEEFAVLLPGTSIEGAEAVASRLCQTIAAQAVDVGGVQITYTVSAGIATMEAGVDGIEALMKRADAALYRAKGDGRNRVECWAGGLLVPQSPAGAESERQT